MVSAFRALILVLCIVVLAGPVCGQEIANWPSPATWTPAVKHGPLHTMSAVTGPLPFIGVTPCRIADTRGNGFTGQYGPPALVANATRSFTITGQCGIPASAAAVSLNFTALNVGAAGDLRVFPAGAGVPLVSTLNYNGNTPNIANAAIVPLGTGGAITVQADAVGIDLVIDTNGYYGSPAANASNVILGPNTGNTTMTGISNTAIGFSTFVGNTTGFQNTASGAFALHNNTSGARNTAAGFEALLGNDSGMENTASGYLALNQNITGSGNTAIGAGALFSTTGTENIGIGISAGANLGKGDSNIDIGNAGGVDESATIRIGNSDIHNRAFLAGVRGVVTGVNDAVAVMIDSAGQLGTVSSSRRFKQDIEDMGEASQGLMRLRPVTFRYKGSLDPTGSPQYGLIAEEVAEVFPDLVVYEKGGQPETVRYHVLVPMLLNEVQKDRKTIAELTARLERLEALMAESGR